MTINTTHLRGRTTHGRGRGWLLGLLSLLAFAFAAQALADSTLKDVNYQTLPGGRIQVDMTFAKGTVPTPRIFTTDDPPRIAIDFANTSNAFSKRHLDIGEGATSGLSVVSAGSRTRVVVELFRSAHYRTSVDGQTLALVVDNGNADDTPTTNPNPTKAMPRAADAPTITGIDFRRTHTGGGRVVIDYSGSGANFDMNRKDGDVVVDLSNVNVPAKYAKKLGVTDFATPVTSIETRPNSSGGQMHVHVNGNVDVSAYQSDGKYVLDVEPKKANDQSKQLIGAASKKKYTGHRVTFNFQDIPVRSALQLLAEFSGLNIVASDSVGGSVTLRLVNVPWDQALDVILRAKGLDKRKNGNVIWIAPQKEIASYEEGQAEARMKAEESTQLVSAYIPISYGKAEDIAKLLTSGAIQGGGGGGSGGQRSRGFLSPRGSVSFDQRTNTLLINDTPEKIQEIRKLVAVLDKPVRQVLIDSRIVAATDSFSRELGVKWGVDAFHVTRGGHVITTSSNTKNASDLNNSITSVARGDSSYVTFPGGYNVNLPVASGDTTGSIALGILSSSYAVNLELSAAQTEGRTEIISSPRVITANQQEADIKQGQEIGYVTYQNSGASGGGAGGTATVQFKDAVLELKVTPTITADNRVYLKINVKKDALNQFVNSPGGGSVPQIDTRQINTSVLVDNGQTVVLGGIYEITKTNNVAKVPGLGDIPILGYLFRSTTRKNDKAELLIFVTPRILSETGR